MTRAEVEASVRAVVVAACSPTLPAERVLLANRYGSVPAFPFATVLLLTDEEVGQGGLPERPDPETGILRWWTWRKARVSVQAFGPGGTDLLGRVQDWLRGPGRGRVRMDFGGVFEAGAVRVLDDQRSGEFEERAALTMEVRYEAVLARSTEEADQGLPVESVQFTVEPEPTKTVRRE